MNRCFLDLNNQKVSGQTLKHGSCPFLPNETRVCAFGLKRARSLSSSSHSWEKASFSLQIDALTAILSIKGREVVFWKARDELYRVVGSEKTRSRKITRKKRRQKSSFWFPTFPSVSGQTLKQGSHHFVIGQTRVSGFGLKRRGILSSRSCGKMALFLPVSPVVCTGKKR